MKKLNYFLVLCIPFLFSCDPNNNKKRYVTRHTYARDFCLNHPYITGDLFRHFSHHIVDDTHIPFYPHLVKEGDVIFLKAKYLQKYIKYMHPFIKNPYVLITGNGDEEVPGEYASLVDDPKIIVWFGMNATLPHPKLIPIPIGGGNKIVEQIQKQPNEKQRLLYLNFQELNHPERVAVKNHFSTQSFCTVDERKPYFEYLTEIRRSKFHLSPRGNGIDCHRVWETILVGSIPILRSTPLDPLYQDLPVLIVKEWSEVTETFLEKAYTEISEKSYHLDKLYVDYWLKIIDSYAGRSYYSPEKLQEVQVGSKL